MSGIGDILGDGLAAPLNSVEGIIHALYTTPGEKIDKETALLRVQQIPDLSQMDVNKQEAAHSSIFVAGWRPFFGWGMTSMLLLGTFMQIFVAPILGCFKIFMPHMDLDLIGWLVSGLLGLSGWRSWDKKNGTTIGLGQPIIPPPEKTT